MKTLVKVTETDNGFTYYDEICRKTGKVMISDFMETYCFNNALKSETFGFELVKPNTVAKPKFRIERGTGLEDCRGRVFMFIDAENEPMLDKIQTMMKEDWSNEDSLSVEESATYEGGLSLLYILDCSDLKDFKESYKQAKAAIRAQY